MALAIAPCFLYASSNGINVFQRCRFASVFVGCCRAHACTLHIFSLCPMIRRLRAVCYVTQRVHLARPSQDLETMLTCAFCLNRAPSRFHAVIGLYGRALHTSARFAPYCRPFRKSCGNGFDLLPFRLCVPLLRRFLVSVRFPRPLPVRGIACRSSRALQSQRALSE